MGCEFCKKFKTDKSLLLELLPEMTYGGAASQSYLPVICTTWNIMKKRVPEQTKSYRSFFAPVTSLTDATLSANSKRYVTFRSISIHVVDAIYIFFINIHNGKYYNEWQISVLHYIFNSVTLLSLPWLLLWYYFFPSNVSISCPTSWI